jgi:hypothetical protein
MFFHSSSGLISFTFRKKQIQYTGIKLFTNLAQSLNENGKKYNYMKKCITMLDGENGLERKQTNNMLGTIIKMAGNNYKCRGKE